MEEILKETKKTILLLNTKIQCELKEPSSAIAEESIPKMVSALSELLETYIHLF